MGSRLRLLLGGLMDDVGGLERLCFGLEKPAPCFRLIDRYC